VYYRVARVDVFWSDSDEGEKWCWDITDKQTDKPLYHTRGMLSPNRSEEDAKVLPAIFKKSASKLPLIAILLEDAGKYAETVADEDRRIALKSTMEDCRSEAGHVQKLLGSVC
jgi:hypothetical protein